ncbi:low temperature requirement protein A [Limosilactobacillus walteri]|uniref:Low temperature requirement protein A n=1 Tax=Limosilactobacillus walteri TaxID=2268022 RepID=A0ABR8P9Z2_9LACO|nr:low temperature requirement protein A [Limosilactobacillus walteri]MBD5807509.1 low temperature requirement protein A [Limosilactobacillus walteri]
MAKEITKKVSLVELFYDLVFVYMVSRATGLIHHVHHGIIGLPTLGIFALVMIIFINSWMVQMVFTNRYGKSSITNIIFSFIDMAIILYMSNAFTATFDRHLSTFFVAAGLLSLTLCLQYLIVYWQTKTQTDRQITQAFSGILAFRAMTLFVGGIFPNRIGITIALVGVLISWIAPGFTGKYTRKHPIVFSHLLERLTALIIVMFGETIIGIADYFTRESLSPQSIMIFITVAALFFTYIVEFDHLIDEYQTNQTGNLMIYLHYFILFGLSLITVALKFISEPEAHSDFSVGCLYLGLILFYIGLIIANYYNKIKVTKDVIACFVITTLLGLVFSLWKPTFTLIVVTITIVVLINAIVLTCFNIRNSNG